MKRISSVCNCSLLFLLFIYLSVSSPSSNFFHHAFSASLYAMESWMWADQKISFLFSFSEWRYIHTWMKFNFTFSPNRLVSLLHEIWNSHFMLVHIRFVRRFLRKKMYTKWLHWEFPMCSNQTDWMIVRIFIFREIFTSEKVTFSAHLHYNHVVKLN